MYVHIAQLQHVPTQCTYSAGATSSAMKKHMIGIEKDRPGTMLRLVRGFHKVMLPALTAKSGSAAALSHEKDTGDGLVVAAEPEATEDIEDTSVPLKACDRCGCPTVVPVCAYCKLIEQVSDFKKENPALFDDTTGHHCSVCHPQPHDTSQAPDELPTGASVTMDVNAMSRKRQKRVEEQQKRSRRATEKTTPQPPQPTPNS